MNDGKLRNFHAAGWAALSILNLALGNLIIAGLAAGGWAYNRSCAKREQQQRTAFMAGYQARQDEEKSETT
jgi:hypothetical protein